MNICINQIRVNVIGNLASINIGTTFIGGNKNVTSQIPVPEASPYMNASQTETAEPISIPEAELISIPEAELISIPEAELMEEPVILPRLEMAPTEISPTKPKPPE